MDPQAQVEKAIEIAWDHSVQADLKSQALDFLEAYKSDPSAWHVCLALFTRTPRASEPARHYCIDLLNYSVQTAQKDTQTLNCIRAGLMDYVQQTYVPGPRSDSSHFQNKIAQSLTYLFVSLYESEWPSFFDDLRALAGNGQDIGVCNPMGTELYLRLLGSIHDEIADPMVLRENGLQKRHNRLKDLIRARDAAKIGLFWQEILARWEGDDMDKIIVDMCLRTISRWVVWVDIQLVVNQVIINALYEISKQQHDYADPTRSSAIDAFNEIIAKKMPPAEKVELMRVLNIGTVVDQLAGGMKLSNQGSPDYDNDLAETVGKLVNTVVTDIVKILDPDSQATQETRHQADAFLQTFITYLLRFFGDEYDEVCSTVIPCLTDLLSVFRRLFQETQTLNPLYHAMLPPILEAIIRKMKVDESLPWGTESEETEEADFQELRKKLRVLQQTVSAIDEPLYMLTIGRVVAETFTSFEANPGGTKWRDLDLALHEMYLFGELAIKNGGLYAKRTPSSAAAQTLLEMMSKMLNAGVGAHNYPTIQLQFMEICVRYYQFFEQNLHYIPTVLEAFVRTIHSDVVRVQTRSWYLFLRFIRSLRTALGDVSQTVIQAIADLLTIKAELPRDGEDDEMSSNDKGESADTLFNSQLYLFESVGCIGSAPSIPIHQKIAIAHSVISPLFTDMETHLGAAKNGDDRAVLQLHHDIMAQGFLARGFSDWMPGATSAKLPPSEVADEFSRAAEAILVALESLKSSSQIRNAARYAFSRHLGVLGTRVLPQLPRWISGLLSESTTNDEMAVFLRTLGQVMYGFKAEIAPILDGLLAPLLQRVFAGLSTPTVGTDDEIQQKELKVEFLNFIITILNQDLAPVLVSAANQPTFDTIINAVSHYASDANDISTARLALGVCTRMTAVWGGPDVALPNTTISNGAVQSPRPVFPGFDTFAVSRFSPLCWVILSTPNFQAKDPQSRSLVTEIAELQQIITKKTGALYLDELKKQLSGMGAGVGDVERYVAALLEGAAKPDNKRQNDGKQGKGVVTGFRGFLIGFLDRG